MIGNEHATAEYPGVGPVIEGWDSISAAMGKSERTIRRWCQGDDPFPMKKLQGRVFVAVADVADWIERNSVDRY